MSDEDDLDDIELDQDDLEKEEEDKEMEEWEDYKKDGEEVSEEVRAGRRGPGAGGWGLAGRAREELHRDVFTALLLQWMPTPLTEAMMKEGLSLLCKTGSGLAHAYIKLEAKDR